MIASGTASSAMSMTTHGSAPRLVRRALVQSTAMMMPVMMHSA